MFVPKPQVWTLFMGFHFALAIAFIGFAIMAYVKFRLNDPCLWALIICISLPVIRVALYFIGDLGKRKGKGQMEELDGFMMEILN